MDDVAVLIPVLNRPHRAQPTVDSLAASLVNITARPVFLASPDDTAEHDAVRATGADLVIVEWEPGQGDYARKLNHAFAALEETFAFLAADDLVYRPGWLDECVGVHEASRACVIGTNDLGNSRVMHGFHSTHTLVHRDYSECGTADDAAVILHEGYWHEFVDDEFVKTAQMRGTFAPARNAVVEHLHPDWGKASWDATYEKARAHRMEDIEHYKSRMHLWGGQFP